MLDSIARKWIDPLCDKAGVRLAKHGITANTMTICGALIGLLAVPLLAQQAYTIACVVIILNRIADGLDGAIARHSTVTDYGSFLDIVLDFIFYNAVVFGFVLSNPTSNGVPGAFLMLSFMGTGVTFLAFAVIAAKRRIETDHQGKKSFYYISGLTEGTETILFFLIACIWPLWFPVLAWIFGTACWVTALSRIYMAYKTFHPNKTTHHDT